ncbi:MAG: amino acid ABC transporter permease [Clostridiales bacterium]|jgi:polar amino acid transport system permease protein|nr:amino acid ABC transporter permease [Clostridiales bacterium]
MEFITVTQSLFEGFAITCLLFVLTLVLSLPLGLLISFCTMSKIKAVKGVFKVFVWVIRGVPLMLQLFIVYYLPGMLSPTGINPFGKLDNYLYFNVGIDNGGALIATLIAFTINYAAYFSEIFRGGIESISKGQYEAGQVLGMTKGQIFRKVVLMQVVKRIMPPISNEVITLVKDTALARVIGVIEIIKVADMFASKAIIWPLFYAGAFYLVFVGVLTVLFNFIEKKLSYYKV